MNDAVWKDHRKFALKAFRTIGVGRPELENSISEEISYLVKTLEATNGKPVNARKYLLPSASNVVAALLTGKRYDYEHPTRQLLDISFGSSNLALPFTSYFANFVPWIKIISPFLPVAKQIAENGKLYHGYIDGEVEEHKKNFKPGEIRDYIDAYLEECESNKGKDTMTKGTIENCSFKCAS